MIYDVWYYRALSGLALLFYRSKNRDRSRRMIWLCQGHPLKVVSGTVLPLSMYNTTYLGN